MRVLELDWGEAAHIRSALVAAGSAGGHKNQDDGEDAGEASGEDAGEAAGEDAGEASGEHNDHGHGEASGEAAGEACRTAGYDLIVGSYVHICRCV